MYVDQDHVAGTPSVNVDDRGGARKAADHLLGLGHRELGIVTVAAEEAHPERQRMLGWLDALGAAGIDPVVAHADSNVDDDAVAAAHSLLAQDVRPTALLCFSDVLALGALRAADRLGLTVPADLSVVGFDDSPVARRSHPALTTVRQDLVGKGRLAADTLMSAMGLHASAKGARARHHLLPTELVVRQTTSRASGSRPQGRAKG